MITPRKAERTIGLAVFAFQDAQRYLLSGGKLNDRDPGTAKKLFAHINPDKLKPADAVALIKELTTVIRGIANQTGVNSGS
jgi:hypothetical protein